jgi:hypothetical protein
MAPPMDEALRDEVRRRARHTCEYCRLPQDAQPWVRFHIEHIRPRQHGGTNEPDNLCLACPHCNRFKGPNLASIDPVTDELTPLFDPRTDQWHQHFSLVEHHILGISAIGRVTVAVLKMNAADRVQLRLELFEERLPEIG